MNAKQFIDKLILKEMKNLTEYEKITPDEFNALPAKPYKPKNAKYSKEGVLGANKKITAIVQQYLKENPETDSENFNYRTVLHYVQMKLQGRSFFTSTPALEQKYKSIELYFGRLIYFLRGK